MAGGMWKSGANRHVDRKKMTDDDDDDDVHRAAHDIYYSFHFFHKPEHGTSSAPHPATTYSYN